MTADSSAAVAAPCVSCLDRRSVLRGAVGLAAATAAGLAVSAGPVGTAHAAGGTWTVLGPVSDVPVGSGRYYENGGDRVVVTQPKAGLVKAFTGYCTHMGGRVQQFPAPHLMQCSSHGSQFGLRSGAVKRGPATTALGTREVRVRAGNVEVR